MSGWVASAIALVWLSSVPLAAQSPAAASVDEVLDRMGAYLVAYESQLTAITADEQYDQAEIVVGGFQERRYARARRRLDSDVAFFRLPGNAEWAGFRAVRRVDGRAVEGRGLRLTELLARGVDVVAQARTITAASSQHNLGARRTTNMPTVPLEVFHPQHRARFRHQLEGTESVRGTRTMRVVFDEAGVPTLIRRHGGGDIRSRGTVWVDPVSGTVWRTEVTFREPGVAPTPSDPGLRVEFELDRRLAIMVPTEMREIFFAQGARGEGKATYRKFKRFETNARIVP